MFGGVGEDFAGSAIDGNVPGYGEGGKIDGGDGMSFLIGDKGVAGEAGYFCSGTAFEASGG